MYVINDIRVKSINKKFRLSKGRLERFADDKEANAVSQMLCSDPRICARIVLQFIEICAPIVTIEERIWVRICFRFKLAPTLAAIDNPLIH